MLNGIASMETKPCPSQENLAANAARIENTPSKQNCHFQFLSFSSSSFAQYTNWKKTEINNVHIENPE